MKIERENAKSTSTIAGNPSLSFGDVSHRRDLRAVSYLLKTSDKRETNTQPEVNDDDQNAVYWKGYN